MPIYEYRCNDCKRRVSLLVRTESSVLACPQCGGRELQRLVSTFSVRRGYMDNYEDILTDSRLVQGLEQSDPRALADWNRRMSRGTDDEVGPEYQEMLERMDAGEMPSEAVDSPGPEGAGEE